VEEEEAEEEERRGSGEREKERRGRGEEEAKEEESRGEEEPEEVIARPRLQGVLLADDDDGEGHDWDDLGGLEHNPGGVVEVPQRVVGQRHATVCVHRD
jgi:hypothetical protein